MPQEHEDEPTGVASERLGADPEPLGTERYERLVDALDSRFVGVDALVGARIVAWIEDADLNLHQARVLLALVDARRPMKPPTVAKRSGLDIDATYKALHDLHGRGLTEETSRRHCLSKQGRELMSSFAHERRNGVRAYLGRLGHTELRRVERALRQPG